MNFRAKDIAKLMEANRADVAPADDTESMPPGAQCAAFLIEYLEVELANLEPEVHQFFEDLVAQLLDWAEMRYADLDFGGDEDVATPEQDEQEAKDLLNRYQHAEYKAQRRARIQHLRLLRTKGSSRQGLAKHVEPLHAACQWTKALVTDKRIPLVHQQAALDHHLALSRLHTDLTSDDDGGADKPSDATGQEPAPGGDEEKAVLASIEKELAALRQTDYTAALRELGIQHLEAGLSSRDRSESSYFAICPRDEHGHCLPRDAADQNAEPDNRLAWAEPPGGDASLEIRPGIPQHGDWPPRAGGEATAREAFGKLPKVPEEVVSFIDARITSEPPRDQQYGVTAYAKGALIGLYDASKGLVQGIANIPHVLANLPKVAANLKATLAEIRRGINERDLQALKNVDPDLYQLVHLPSYNALTDWQQGRLTSRVIFKYAALVEGGIQGLRAVYNIGRAGLTQAKALGKVIAAEARNRVRRTSLTLAGLTEEEAGQILEQMQSEAQKAGVNAHFYDRHGAQTELEEQAIRAETGVPPEGLPPGVKPKPVDSGRFLSHRDELAAAFRAREIYRRTNESRWSFDMGRIIGEGFPKKYTSLPPADQMIRTSNVTAVFKNGHLLTLYPELAPLK